MLDFIKNKTVFANKYKTNSEAIIISCFFNPQKSPYRTKAFNIFYESIKHLNHRIIECVIGDAQPELPENESISRVHSDSLLWHKEALLNKVISELPEQFKYIFWVDADVIFTNNNWLVDGVKRLKKVNIIQPFEYCVHLEKDEVKPSFYTGKLFSISYPNELNKKVWRSFASNVATNNNWTSDNYNLHGHVGFAWGARREILEMVPLYDKALIGGADHIIAHAAVGQTPCHCIDKSFTDDLTNVYDWSKKFYAVAQGKVSYVEGALYHIWHGDIDKRQYLKRIKDFTPVTKTINKRDRNGLFVTETDDAYIRKYFMEREVSPDDGFLNSMAIGYMTDNASLGMILGGNPAGAILGDILNTNDETPSSPIEQFEGGNTGGGGANGSWGNPSDNTNNVGNDVPLDTSDNENFS